jgi:hypothetical protein
VVAGLVWFTVGVLDWYASTDPDGAAATHLRVLDDPDGLVWAKEAWGFYINWDVKNVVSLLIPVPFIAEDSPQETLMGAASHRVCPDSIELLSPTVD